MQEARPHRKVFSRERLESGKQAGSETEVSAQSSEVPSGVEAWSKDHDESTKVQVLGR